MNRGLFVADHTRDEYPAGAELVDYNIYHALKIPFVKSSELSCYDSSLVYILSNATFIRQDIKKQLIANGNYIILEHDYKIHSSRQPSRYPGCRIPIQERQNYDYYKAAKQVILQSKDHLECFNDNEVEANFHVQQGSVWNESELTRLENLSSTPKKTHCGCIMETTSPDKGSDIGVAWCKDNNFDFELIPKLPLLDFYSALASYPTLIYFPRVRESFCRLVVEARCLNMNVLTYKAYGAVKEPWFSKRGLDMIAFLRECTSKNLEHIRTLIV